MSIYNMKLHEAIHPKERNVEIVRVAGGWIYNFYHDTAAREGELEYQATSVFVPFDNEFQDKEGDSHE